jgi:superfamily II DNA or RNA helicase
MRIPVQVDTQLSLDGQLVGHDIAIQIFDELTFPNEAYSDAKRRRQYGWWDLPEYHYLAYLDRDEIVMPRGYALRLKKLLREHGHSVRWIDHMTWEAGPAIGPDEFEYRFHQPDAVDAIKKHRQLIYKAPTGSGKTVTGLGFIWEKHPAFTLVLVDRINLVDQWINRIHKHLGADIKVGTRDKPEQITVCTIQSLWSKRDELYEAGWFNRWSAVILDECHHVTAETYNDLMQMFPARYRVGMSATPDKTGVFEIAQATLGPVLHETPEDILVELGLIMIPHVEVVTTDFDFVFWGDHESDDEGYCEVPGCKKSTKHRHRNNYGQVKKAVVNDDDRNDLIAQKIIEVQQSGEHHQLVITNETTHIDNIYTALEQGGADLELIRVITGKQTRKQRDEIIKLIEASPESIILSTVAGEALDIPVIDVVHLPFPTGNPRKTEQEIGRGRRTSEGKGGTVVFDYVDNKVGPLAKQFRKRRWQCYEVLGMEVIVPE